MKPPCLPGAEKFRFCDRKFDQIPRKIFPPIVNNINDCCFEEQSLFEIENNRHSPSKNSSSSNEKDPDYLLELSHHSSSSDSLSCHSCIDGRANHLLQSTKTIKCDQKSLDSVSTVSSNLDDLIHQMNGYSLDSHRRHGRHPKRKPILPISTRLTSRVLNLTSYHIDTNTNNDNDDDVDDGHHSINNDDEVDADVEDEFEETQSKRNLFPNEIEKKSFSTKPVINES
ncbi:hypothetical protein QR98_0017460 [Sarcoptes scabiei]|uniref:Uncharacterized protein n=1 Tax=Sarcoptes scabiei TaxID=52283 RepID=A0A131ZWY3_SARSC|nr:hypothetical protein QR98_0017460 [Sarcoptes scabiei]